jgi:hypothetical protein
VQLGPEHAAALDRASRPRLAFPGGFLSNIGPLAYSGTTINGETFTVSPFAPKNDAERF